MGPEEITGIRKKAIKADVDNNLDEIIEELTSATLFQRFITTSLKNLLTLKL